MMPADFRIDGRTVIVTGAARGIGKGIVRVFAEAGARVLVTALTDKYLKLMSEEFDPLGYDMVTLVADATDADDWQRTVDMALDRWGHVDALVNNLGDAITRDLVPPPGSGDKELSDDEWKRVVDINLTHAFLGC